MDGIAGGSPRKLLEDSFHGDALGIVHPKTGAIRINARLAAYPPECLSYVVAHELAHLLEPTHNARFHAIVARAIPNEPEIRARMRKPPVG